jgi:hypothetical protein
MECNMILIGIPQETFLAMLLAHRSFGQLIIRLDWNATAANNAHGNHLAAAVRAFGEIISAHAS